MKYCTVCNAKYDDTVSFCAADGEVLEDDPTSIVNSTLDGQYHIEVMLGKGGMGAVYRARHILLGDRVAIKVLPPQMRNNAEWLRRFRREGQAARRFRHPNAVTVYDLRTTNEGLIYMVMEYVEGRTLDAELKARGRFTPADALSILEPVMSVLNAAHAQGVVHRDLKPENIMIGKPVDGQSVVKLLDLGIAKISELAGADSGGSTALTVAGQILGTPFYMSPEQWGEVSLDGKSEIDGRADIYSLGVVFYELVNGRRPFIGLTLQELRREHVSVAPKPLNEVSEGVAESYSRAVARAMSKDRSDRQSTAGDLANELRASLGLPAMSTSSPTVGSTTNSMQAPSGDASERTGADTGGGPPSQPTGDSIATPTVLTLDSQPPAGGSQQVPAATSLAQPPSISGGQPSHEQGFVTPQPPPMPTIATNPNAAQNTNAFVPQSRPTPPPTSYQQGQPSISPPPSYAPQPSAPARKSKSPVIPIVIGLVLLLVVVGVAGGIFIYMRSGSSTDGGTTNGGNKDQGTDKKTDGDKGGQTSASESMRYWLEIENANGSQSARVAGVVPLNSGQAFRFHFSPQSSGYLYIVGPGEGNAPTTFLTAKPIAASGVTTNSLSAGANYSFPAGDGNWITLDNRPGTELYTVIFSKAPITSLDFLNSDAGSALSTDQQSELEEFLKPYKANGPTTDVNDENGDEAYVSVKTTQPDRDVLVFDVRIEHK